MSVKRYELTYDSVGNMGFLKKIDGTFMHYSDYADLKTSHNALREALRTIADDETDYPRDVARRALEEK